MGRAEGLRKNSAARHPGRWLICQDGERSEDGEQRDFAAFLDELALAWPTLFGRKLKWHHNPNGGARTRGEGGKLKAQGVKSGVLDNYILTPPPAHPGVPGVAIELKRANSGATSSEQDEWLTDLLDLGWICAVCHGAREAIALIKELGYDPR